VFSLVNLFGDVIFHDVPVLMYIRTAPENSDSNGEPTASVFPLDDNETDVPNLSL
jgi:hypothetical protein